MTEIVPRELCAVLVISAVEEEDVELTPEPPGIAPANREQQAALVKSRLTGKLSATINRWAG